MSRRGAAEYVREDEQATFKFAGLDAAILSNSWILVLATETPRIAIHSGLWVIDIHGFLVIYELTKGEH